jgi:hypothetical protein
VKPGLLIKVLPLEANGVGNAGFLSGGADEFFGLAPGLVLGRRFTDD